MTTLTTREMFLALYNAHLMRYKKYDHPLANTPSDEPMDNVFALINYFASVAENGKAATKTAPDIGIAIARYKLLAAARDFLYTFNNNLCAAGALPKTALTQQKLDATIQEQYLKITSDPNSAIGCAVANVISKHFFIPLLQSLGANTGEDFTQTNPRDIANFFLPVIFKAWEEKCAIAPVYAALPCPKDKERFLKYLKQKYSLDKDAVTGSKSSESTTKPEPTGIIPKIIITAPDATYSDLPEDFCRHGKSYPEEPSGSDDETAAIPDPEKLSAPCDLEDVKHHFKFWEYKLQEQKMKLWRAVKGEPVSGSPLSASDESTIAASPPPLS